MEFRKVLSSNQDTDCIVAQYAAGNDLFVVKRTAVGLCDPAALHAIVGLELRGAEVDLPCRVDCPLAVWQTARHMYEIRKFYNGTPLSRVVATNKYRIRGQYLGGMYNGLLQALGVLHDAGIVHRDVRPQNLLLQPDGGIVLIDNTFSCHIAGHQKPVANPPYSPPEQVDGRAEPRSDWYALAATVFYVANGFPPNPSDGRRYLEGLVAIDTGPLRASFSGMEEEDRYLDGSPGLFAALLQPELRRRPRRRYDAMLERRSYAITRGVDAILDAGDAGYLALFRTSHRMVPRNEIDDFLRQALLQDELTDERLNSDARRHLDGHPLWLTP
jgi:serine/threonine protein kinase